MTVNAKVRLAVITSLCLAALSAGARTVEPDTTSKSQAISLAKAANKMIMLIVSDTNSCSGCISLEFTSLPTTTPPIRQMISESFVYWKCGGEVKTCSDFTTYTGTGSFPLPAYFVIDPDAPQTYRSSGFGGGDPVTFYNFLTRGLLKATFPRITNVVAGAQNLAVPGTGAAANLVVNTADVVLQGQSFSTNMTLKRLRYSLNNGAWTYFTISNRLSFELPLHLNPGLNTLKFYANDISGNYTSRTNISTFVFDSSAPTGPSVTLTSPANGASYGSDVSFSVSATATPGSSGISHVDFYYDSVLLKSVTTSPYTAQVTAGLIPAGNHVLTAQVVDSAGLTATSSPVNITIVPAVQAPVLTFFMNPDFGIVDLGSSSPSNQVELRIVNTGGQTLSGDAKIYPSSSPFSIIGSNSYSLSAGATQVMSVAFAPTALGLPSTNAIIFTSNGGNTNFEIFGSAAYQPVPSFGSSTNAGLAPLLVMFTNNSSGTITTLTWDFGDGTTTNTANTAGLVLAHTYQQATNYLVTVRASGPLGIVTSQAYSIQVIAPAPEVTIELLMVNGVTQMHWSSGTLQSATNINGPFVSIPGAKSGYPLINPSKPKGAEYFRILVQ